MSRSVLRCRGDDVTVRPPLCPDPRVQVRMDSWRSAQHAGLNINTLYGEFTSSGHRNVRCAVSLTDRELVVQRLRSAPAGRSRVALSLKDCVGCRAYREGDSADPAAYLVAYFYPLKRRWAGTGLSRQRVEQCFRLAALQEPLANLEEAQKWARAVRERSNRLRDGVLLSELSHPCRLLLLVNPHSGKGHALTLYNSHVKRMLNEAGVLHTLFITEHQNHAREHVREADLSQWDALVVMSGDGLLFEVINGLLERSDWEDAILTPLGILPGGSGNALAASLHHYVGASLVSSEELLVSCGFLLCKGVVSRMDLVSVHLSSGTRLFSFLSLAWGFVADVDIESEKYRHVGAARFTLGTLVRLASLRVYKGKLAYLPATGDRNWVGSRLANNHSTSSHHSMRESPMQNSFHNSCNSNNSLKARRIERSRISNRPQTSLSDSLLPSLEEPLPGNWVVVPEEDFVLVLAMYQSHLAEDLLAAPDATLDEGIIHLFYVKAGISRAALLRLFLAMEKGAHMVSSCAHLVHTKVLALRLEPYSPKGIITVDGEVVEYGPVQAEVHRGIARIISA
ncbi:LOW QUALITY PROTEIN: sphingosine kinase 1-like [Syngnathoides biaculeatus]|uniref:LOW QUALITY PROTEIN: sphingosine kinase 1-like n=1 Tax=Syngnathoides biaculeatus TaxID=300417 RepID=UPI002ADD5D85|nr:LOW QUALITY PROTEIN: sphingosine kinase 1-like [Syngnathoides biaculeatus]